MKTTCERITEGLLLLVHNELRGWPRFQVEAHLLLCPTCRAKERSLRSLSTTLAISLKNPSLGSRTFRRSRRAVWATLGVGAASALFVGSQLIGAPSGTAIASSYRTGAFCDMDHAPVSTKHAAPPVPKPVVKAVVSGAVKHECPRQSR